MAAVFMKAAGGSDQSFSSASFDILKKKKNREKKKAQLAARSCSSNKRTIQSDLHLSDAFDENKFFHFNAVHLKL